MACRSGGEREAMVAQTIGSIVVEKTTASITVKDGQTHRIRLAARDPSANTPRPPKHGAQRWDGHTRCTLRTGECPLLSAEAPPDENPMRGKRAQGPARRVFVRDGVCA
jgi:hypothetical protein